MLRFLWWKIERQTPIPIGGVRALNEAVVDLQDRVDKLERHRAKVAVKTIKEEESETEVEKVLDEIPQLRDIVTKGVEGIPDW